MKKSKSIAFSISIFFILLNVLTFGIVFYLTEMHYFEMARRNIHGSNAMAAEAMQRDFSDVLSYMNDLTLKMYADKELNRICSRIYRGEYANPSQRENLAFQAEALSYDYLYHYGFIQSIGIFLENRDETEIYLRKSHSMQFYNVLTEYRETIQAQVIENEGVIRCFDVGTGHQIVFARTLRDFENVLKDDRIIGTVMVTLSPKYLGDALENTLVTPNSYAVLVNENQVVSHSTRREDVGKPIDTVCPPSQKGQALEYLSLPLDALGQELVIATPREDISLSSGEFTRMLFLSGGIMLLMNLVLVMSISRLLTRPMKQLVAQMQKIGITTLESEYVEVRGYSEVEMIARDFNRMLERIEHLVKENYLVSLNEKNARIEALQSQINPHFIFNTLDTINWKVMFLDVPEVTDMISSLGGLLRYTTYQYGRYVSVEQEIEQIRNYLYIQEIRFDHSFRTRIAVEEEAAGVRIPCLLLQPLVENAVVHGLKEKKQGILAVRARIRGEDLEIMVLDNGKGMEPEKICEILEDRAEKRGESIGLANVNQRLRLTYSLQQGLRITSRPGRYARVEIRIPLGEIQRRGEAYDSGDRSR